MRSLFVLIILLISSLLPVMATEQIELVVSRSQHQLFVKKNGITLRSFKVAFGSAGRKAKLREGDNATPKGDYRITKVRKSGRFHLFLQINYPNGQDAKRGFDNKSISLQQYRAIMMAHDSGRLPPQNTQLGGAIGIHGIGHETSDKIDIHQLVDWTNGCIAMRNHEVEELSRYIEVGTRISIID